MYSISEVICEVKIRASLPLFRALVRQRRIKAVSALMNCNVKEIQAADPQENQITDILFLPKAGFNEDLMASLGGHGSYGLYALDRRFVRIVSYAFLPKEIDNFNYRSDDPQIEGLKRALRSFWIQVFGAFLEKRRIDALMTGNFSFAVEQELVGAFEEMGIPVIALHKECLNTPRLEDFYIDIYKYGKNPFQGSKILVYNESERRIQVFGGISASENIVITGMPRLDNVHRFRERQGKAKKISNDHTPVVLFFTFNPKTGLPFLAGMGEERRKAWCERLGYDVDKLSMPKFVQGVHHAMLDLAVENPHIEVIIKTKGNVRTFKNLEKVFGKNPSFPKNLKFVHGGDPFDLIVKSTVVCGFNSTALLEAIALNKPVIVPRFGEALEEKITPYIIDLRNAVEYANSPEELIEQLVKECKNADRVEYSSELSPIQVDVLEEFTGNGDGNAGLRVRNMVAKVVEERRKIIGGHPCLGSSG